ncbi:MAG: UDP-N-acetylglucosamine 2-epimerase [Pseudomonadota bacterium]|nr:UDP-N-acetylglucosamine 2-epimerase [Pseudomonadota bacterium]
MKKICVVTGTRAEYGLLKHLMRGIQNSKKLELQIIVTGMHLSKKFGYTINEILDDKFKIDHKVDIKLVNDTSLNISKSMGIGIEKFSSCFKKLNPDLVLVLGDRYEIFAAAISAMLSRIPIAHLHGGEATEGLIDEPIRHSISKMSHLHFVASEEYKNRVIQLGEDPKKVFNVGALGLDSISKEELYDQKDLENILDMSFCDRNFLVTFHPVTLEKNSSKNQFKEILNALMKFKDYGVIFTMPNSDLDGEILFSMIKNFVKSRSNAFVFESLGQQKYFSCLKIVDLVIGNSSSGLIEVPAFKIPTINIGDRQRGRLKASSVIDCNPLESAITKSIKRGLSPSFRSSLKKVNNPYGKKGASSKIVSVLESVSFKNLLKKEFYNISF